MERLFDFQERGGIKKKEVKLRQIKNFEDIRDQIIFTIKWSDLFPILQRLNPKKKNESRYVMLCPFHKDGHASCFLLDGSRRFKCLGCGKGGDMIYFFSEIKKITYLEAVIRLAKFLKIKIEWD